MLKNKLLTDHLRLLRIEYLQSEEEGKNVSDYQSQINDLLSSNESDENKENRAGYLLDAMYNLPIKESFPYTEPSDIGQIKALRPTFNLNPPKRSLNRKDLFEKVYGAWLGRCVGCLLGQPIEGWKQKQIDGLLRDTDNYPIKYYISSNIDSTIKIKYGMKDQYFLYGNRPTPINWINHIDCMPEDDDINYTLAALSIMETYGGHFTSEDVAESWLTNIPLLHTFTAERLAYRNLSIGKLPPDSATFRNPYREWIGAQIRGDFWGYIHPNNIEVAAEMAFRDAEVSHVKNGIYGSMFTAALLSAAWRSNNIVYLIECGLSQIPENCRLSKHIRLVLIYYLQEYDEQQVITEIHRLFDEQSIHHWCHSISNAMIVCFALLYGKGDFEKSVGLAIICGFDTDCNAATVGSVCGLLNGASRIASKWTDPLHDTLQSGVRGFEKISISELAERTVNIILQYKD